MDNRINGMNGISFQANLVTSLKGRHNIMDDVAKRFAEKTKRIPGTLNVERADKLIVGPKVHALEFDAGARYILSDGYENILGNNLKNKSDVTSAIVEKITNTFVNIFKALTCESKFQNKIDPLVKNIQETRQAMNLNLRIAAKLKDKDPVASELYTKLAEHNRARLTTLESELAVETQKFQDKASKIGKDDPNLDVWRIIVSES